MFQKKQRCVLLADEVGLGKTIVARKTIEMLSKRMRQKVTYFCPSESIARQNILKLSGFTTFNSISEYRLPMLHLKLAEKNASFVPMTPETSLNMGRKPTGAGNERALIFCILNKYLRRFPSYQDRSDQNLSLVTRERRLSKLLNFPNVKDWTSKIKYYQKEFEKHESWYDKNFQNKLISELNNEIYFESIAEYYENTESKPQSFKEFFDYLFTVEKLRRLNRKIHTQIILYLRLIFAKISCKLLKTNLVIMDEFQRYNNLFLSNDSKSDKDSFTKDDSDSIKRDIANILWNKSKVLLLSATPYKPYYTADELSSESQSSNDTDSSNEFKGLIQKLLDNGNEYKLFEKSWGEYTQKLGEFCNNPSDNDIFEKTKKLKQRVERVLKRIICRTERYNGRMSQNESDQNNLISSDQVKNVQISKGDVLSYINIKAIAENVNDEMLLPDDFVKSSPYLMSFMGQVIPKSAQKNAQKIASKHSYKIFSSLYDFNKKKGEKNQTTPLIDQKDDTSFINKELINNFKSLVDRDGSANNARLKTLFDTILPKDNNTERLLWVPASRPYYKASGEQYPIGDIFSKNVGFSKVLLFSHWKMVPSMIASLVSYESDSRLFHLKSRDKSKFNYNNFLKKKRARLNKSCAELLEYPSDYLASLDIRSLVPNFTLDEAMKVISRKIKTDLQNRINDPNRSDNDKLGAGLNILEFNDQSSWKDEPKGVPDNYRKILEFLNNPDIDKPDFPDDAAIVLAQLTLASPAVCFLRTFKQRGWSVNEISQFTFNKNNNQKEDSAEGNALSSKEILNNAAANFADKFLSIFRQTSAQKILDIVYKRQNKRKRGRFWQIIKYCVEGNLQAVLDEFAFQCQSPIEFYQHFFSSDRSSNEEVITSQGDSKPKTPPPFARHGRIEIGTQEAFLEKNGENIIIRTGFARMYSASSTMDDSVLRNAFNSPFRPFVLASTSIGQEGLDFHAYCRKIMHWNLPSNPIDLEQREGRINRYMSLAIRQSLANSSYAKNASLNDFWTNLINNVKEGKDVNDLKGGMIPYWILPNDKEFKNPQFPIERIVPMYPFSKSKDQEKYNWIIKVLSMYRLTLGQPNQEELLRSLDNANIPKTQLQELFFNLSPFFGKLEEKTESSSAQQSVHAQ